MITGSFIEGITRDEFIDLCRKVDAVLENQQRILEITETNVRNEYTLGELAQIKGYSKVHLRRIIDKKHIPFKKDGCDIVISKEHSALIKCKKALE